MRAFNKDAGHCGEGLVDSKYKQAWTILSSLNGHHAFHLNFTSFIKITFK